MPSKRKADEAGQLSARERKKLRVADARTIAVQPVASASSGRQDDQQTNHTNPVAGPSKTVVSLDTMKGLPTTIDVERFTEARAYEIDAMQKAIKSAGESSTHRAWQTLPRHLRRRAASHNVRRVPLRLRDKARAEERHLTMDPVKRKTHKALPKRGKAKQITRTESLLKRQRDKTWLETHIWHAKRAKMENLWGYRLAVTPTEKAFRPSHRASIHGSILHDASYYATIELNGPEGLLKTTLEACCDPQTLGFKQCISGSRACDTHIYEHGRWPLGLIGPITVIWQPLSPDSMSSTTPTTGGAPTKSQNIHKGKTKQKPVATESITDSSSKTRVIWVRAHPAVFEDVFDALKNSASHALQTSKEKNPDLASQIEMGDLRGSINAFEIMGPKSSQVIKGALSPVGSEDRAEFKKFWASLADLQTAGSLPRGMVIGFKINDPRLKFPPKNAKPSFPDMTNPPALPSNDLIFPSSGIAQTEIWDGDKRDVLKKPKYKKKDLDERRSKNLVPGTKLNPLRQDDRIPVMLIQHSLEICPPSSRSTTSFDNGRGIHGWSLLFPAGWSMALLSSLIYTGTRFAGQRERIKQYFEAGIPGFPVDYPSSRVCEVASEQHAESERGRWERTPPAKRASWEKLGTRSPWRADWGVVLGLESSEAVATTAEGFVTTQRETAQGNETVRGSVPSVRQPWLLRGSKVPSILADPFTTPSEFLTQINKLRNKHHMPPLGKDVLAEDLWHTALVMIRAKMVRRGAPSDLANIYKMNDIEARKWLRAIGTTSSAVLGDADEPTEHELSEIKADQGDIIGYVTTGDLSLSRGEGFALGAIPVAQYVALRRQAQR
ncbi:ribonucleases P/MRP protein subunit POP1-domain-containing protein [Scleroderma citrinum]